MTAGAWLILQVFAFIWGAVWGSFLNVVIYRLPLGMSLSRPGSRCGHCLTPIRWYDNIPVLSYLLLRGRCRACKTGYSPRYMLIEAMCGVLVLALFRAVVADATAENFYAKLALWGWYQVFIYGLVACAFIDLAETFLPEELTIPMLIVGVCGPFFLGVPPLPHVYGALAGGGVILLIYAVGFLIFRREAMGLGDAMLLAVIGAFVGWRSLPFVLFAAAVQGIIATVASLLYTRVTGKSAGLTLTTAELDARFGEEDRFDDDGSRLAIPFGPFLALAGLQALFFGPNLLWDLAELILGR